MAETEFSEMQPVYVSARAISKLERMVAGARACAFFVKSICSTGDICDIKWRMNVAALIDNRLISHRRQHVVVTFNHDTFLSNRFYFFTIFKLPIAVRGRAFPFVFFFHHFYFILNSMHAARFAHFCFDSGQYSSQVRFGESDRATEESEKEGKRGEERKRKRENQIGDNDRDLAFWNFDLTVNRGIIAKL